MTAGLVNALCASTHLVVPFVLDLLSAERVGLFLRTVKRMRGQLFPHLELAGVVGTMKGDGTQKLRDAEREAIAEAERGVRNWAPGNYVLANVLIPRKQLISDTAGVGINWPSRRCSNRKSPRRAHMAKSRRPPGQAADFLRSNFLSCDLPATPSGRKPS
jgi:hypothetical protein